MTNVNQQLIADRLGISRTTVSRCFTNHLGINPVTRAKVFDLASQLGYQHMEMRAPAKLRRPARKAVAVLICTEIEEYFRPDYQSPGKELHAGISEYAQIHNLRLSLHYISPHDEDLDAPSYRKVEALWNRSVDGIILIYPFPRKVVDGLHLTFPMVSLVEQYGRAAFNCVDADHYKGIGMLVNLLMERGHRRIGFYTKTYEVEAQWSLRRFGAYAEEMVRLGLGFSEEDVVSVYPQHILSLEESFDYVYQRVQAGVTAWVCAADHQAYDLVAALQQRGLRVPEDVSVTGFDGIEKPVQAPLLTTALIPYREIGFTGMKLLTGLMSKRFGSAQHILVATQIREGETVAAPPVHAGRAGKFKARG
jgi:DNA-binding LacI/PurR family transcriptional regulator